jgi:putative membrane protein
MLNKKVIKGLLGVSAVAALFGALAAQAQTTQSPSTSQGKSTTAPTTAPSTAGAGTLSKSDQKAVMDMARANMAEIEAGKLAQSKSQNEQVKNFAQQMIDDHTKALTDVQQVAQAKGVTLPTDLDSKHKAMADKLSAMSGDAFDRAYMAQAGVSDHKKVHSMLKQYQSRAKDPDVKALAAKMLPTVDQHLNAAMQISGGAKGGAKGAKPPATGGASDQASPGKTTQ